MIHLLQTSSFARTAAILISFVLITSPLMALVSLAGASTAKNKPGRIKIAVVLFCSWVNGTNLLVVSRETYTLNGWEHAFGTMFLALSSGALAFAGTIAIARVAAFVIINRVSHTSHSL